MTRVQRASQIFGFVFILTGLLGLLASGGSTEADPATAPHLLGLFPVNLLHNVIHLATGIWGLAASRSWSASLAYTRVFGAIYLLLVPLAFLSPSLFGLMPIGGHDVWLHLLLALGLLYFGFSARRPAEAPAEPRARASAGTV